MTQKSHKKGIYIYYKKLDFAHLSGVDQKVLNQIHAMQDVGMKVRRETLSFSPTFVSKVLSRLPFTNLDPVWHYRPEYDEVDFLYLRRPFFIGAGFRRMLKKLKHHNPNAKVLVEIPTYPYEQEFLTKKENLPLLLRDRYNRTRLRGLIDSYIVVSDQKGTGTLWNVPAVYITNGIRFADTKMKQDFHEEDVIHILCLAMFEWWHGYERLLKGLASYYREGGERHIVLHFAGVGSQNSTYEGLVQDLGLSANVIFHGMVNGQELDHLYDCCDLACGSLGNHRKGILVESSLKSREFMAKGLPMMAGCGNDAVDDHYPYYLQLPADESDINIEDVIRFHDGIYAGQPRELVYRSIRSYAEKKIDMNVTMRPIFERIDPVVFCKTE